MSNVYFDTFQGLLPGLMSNASQINPMQILLSFVSGPTSTCQEITMETIDSEDKRDTDTAYVLNKDIELIIPERHSIYNSPIHEFHIVHPYLMINWLNQGNIPEIL